MVHNNYVVMDRQRNAIQDNLNAKVCKVIHVFSGGSGLGEILLT